MSKSEQLFFEAQKYIPGGVNSPVRAFMGVGGHPIFFKRAFGAYLYDEDNNSYIDFVGSWGPMILGHNHPEVILAVKNMLDYGVSFGAPTKIETQMAKKICTLIPAIELVRMVNSGTEAVMSAVRLARGYTQRDKIIKFEGCYHGHSDALLVKAGSGALTLGEPSSKGVPKDLAKHTLILAYNDVDALQDIFKSIGSEIACVIVEPVAGNMNCVLPIDGFLETLRTLCDEYASVLIFDEVMSGFRVALGGASSYYNITPDLVTLGKVIGAGFPVGAFGGKTKIMRHIAPLGGVYQAGTLSGNPVAIAAGLATLNILSDTSDFYEDLHQKTRYLVCGILQCAHKYNIKMSANSIGAMFGLFFTNVKTVTRFDEVMSCDIVRFKKFYHLMLTQGIYFAPSPYEAGFISSAHSYSDIDKTIAAADYALSHL